MSPQFIPLAFFGCIGVGHALSLTAAPGTVAAMAETRELSRKEIDLGTHRVSYVRITPPNLPALPIPAPETAPVLTPEQLAAEEVRAAKTYESLAVTAIVYLGGHGMPTVTDLSWWHEGRRHQAWSNADFRLLSQLTEVETATHVFSWFPFVSDAPPSAELAPAERPAGLALFSAADTFAHYYVQGTETDLATVSTTLACLDHLHAYYQLHHERLAADHARLVALNAEREAELARNPPRPPDTVIYFWKAAPATTSTPR